MRGTNFGTRGFANSIRTVCETSVYGLYTLSRGVSEAKTPYFSNTYVIIHLIMPGAEQRGGEGWTRRDVLRFVRRGAVVTGAALVGISCGNNEPSLTAEE